MSPPIELIAPDGFRITSLEEWRDHAKPKRGDYHWKPYRSAQENAKAWIEGMPADLIRLLESHPATAGFQYDRAFPENIIRLDDFGREQRNSDITVHGKKSTASIVIDVEAKADEPFGSCTIAETVRKAAGKPKSGIPRRVSNLVSGVFGCHLDDKIGALRYQLLYSIAAAVIEADRFGASIAAFIVQEFHSQQLNPRKLRNNNSALQEFVKRIPGWEQESITPGIMLPPITLPGAGRIRNDIPLSIGRVVTQLT